MFGYFYSEEDVQRIKNLFKKTRHPLRMSLENHKNILPVIRATPAIEFKKRGKKSQILTHFQITFREGFVKKKKITSLGN